MTDYIERTEAESAALKRVLDAIRSIPRGCYIEINADDGIATVWRRDGPSSATMAGPAARLSRKKVGI